MITLELSLEELRVLHHALRVAQVAPILERMQRLRDLVENPCTTLDDLSVRVGVIYERSTK